MPSTPDQQSRKKTVNEFFGLIAQGRQMEALKFFTPDCRQHNPYVKGGMKELFDAMKEAQREMGSGQSGASLEVRRLVAEGDIIAAHTEICDRSKLQEGGLRQVHIFRFGPDDRIVEYWDVTQSIQPRMPSPGNAF